MLSKSQARNFFLLGTLVCAGTFVVLTLDTFQRIPKQTNQNELNASAIRGKHLFDKNNCMGCHTILGEGAYYAPELTRVYSRRGDSFIKAMLKDPEKMYPGERKMVNYHFKDEEIDDLVAFLKWIDKIDLNGFPKKPDLIKQSTTNSAIVETGNRPQVFNQMCIACHTLHGQGGDTGPNLDTVGARRDAAYIEKWLRDPSSIKPDALMPKLPLSDSDIKELTAFLSQLKESL